MRLATTPALAALALALLAPPSAAWAQDLAVTKFAATASGSTVTYTMTVCNKSRTNAPAVTLALYLDRAAAPRCADRGDLAGTLALPAGACESFKVAGPLPAGVYRSWLFIDATCRLREPVETNNTMAAKVAVRSGADLSVKSATVTGVPGGVVLKGTVCANKVQARPFSVGVWLNKAKPTCADKPDIAGEVDIPAGTCVSFSEGFPQKPGKYVLSMMLDNTCLVPETNETNNTGGGSYVVPGSTCRSNADCGKSEYCALPLGCTGTGTCKVRPRFCIKIYKPVCGCDGRTYGNACEAAAAGVSVKSNGPCPKLACKDIEAAYTKAVSAAKKCNSVLTVLQCTRKVRALLSCACETYVNPANSKALADMAYYASLWSRQMCKPSIVCRCAMPKGARCTAGAGSPGDACKDYF